MDKDKKLLQELQSTTTDWVDFLNKIVKPGNTKAKWFWYRRIKYRAEQFDEVVEKEEWAKYGVIPF